MVWSKPVDWREQADNLRQQGRWVDAQEAYNKHLLSAPTDGEAWIFYAECLRECSMAADADLATLISTSLDALPSNSAGRTPVELSTRPGPHTGPAGLRLIFSMQDFLLFLNDYVTMSGIQRVQAGIALSAMDIPGVDVRFIAVDQADVLSDGDFWEIRHSDLRDLIQFASSQNVEHASMRELVARCQSNATVISPGPDDVVILLGCFWSHGNTVDRFIASKRAGARIAAYLYDIIPISHPQFVTSDLSRVFATSLSELCEVADFLLTISDYTRVTFADFLTELGKPQIPMMTVPLAHALTATSTQVKAWPQALRALRGREYVTYVSTIEGRKNHIYVIQAWRQMMAAGIDVPDLVFVGRKGWRISGLMDLLDGTDFLGGRVHFVHDVSDGELNAIYEHSLFTVFTSFVEGWGLPVGESLLHNRVCVASATSSVPEVGEAFAEYVDPLDVRDGVRVFSRLILDRAHLSDRQRNIEQNFKPREWSDVADDFISKTLLLAQGPRVESRLVALKEGLIFEPGSIWRESTGTGVRMMTPWRLIIAESFYPSEKFGAWMRGRAGEIAFRSDLPPGTEIIAYLGLTAAPWASQCKVRVRGTASTRAPVQSVPLDTVNSHGMIMVNGVIADDQTCRIRLEIVGAFTMPEHERRSFVVGLTRFSFAKAANLETRLDIGDAFSLTLASDRG